MKIVIARMNHETNTFSPVATPLAVFGRNGPSYGEGASTATKACRRRWPRSSMPPGPPLAVTGVVRALTDGEYAISGPTNTGQRAFMGCTAVLAPAL